MPLVLFKDKGVIPRKCFYPLNNENKHLQGEASLRAVFTLRTVFNKEKGVKSRGRYIEMRRLMVLVYPFRTLLKFHVKSRLKKKCTHKKYIGGNGFLCLNYSEITRNFKGTCEVYFIEV